MAKPLPSTKRTHTPPTSSSSINDSSSSSMGETDESPTPVTDGSFDAGLTNSSLKSVAEQDHCPPCPQPVRRLLQGLGIVLAAGGMVSMIYGGMKLTTPDDPGVDAARGKHMALMVTGAVELAIAFLACISAMKRGQPDPVQVNPA